MEAIFPLTPEKVEMFKEIKKIGKILVSLVLLEAPNRVKEFLRAPRFLCLWEGASGDTEDNQ